MLNEIVFVLTLFVTRVALPVLFTLYLGRRLERALNHTTTM